MKNMISEVQYAKFSNSVKRKTQKYISTRFLKLIRSELKNGNIPTINTNDLKVIRNFIIFIEQVFYPKLPQNTQKIQHFLFTINLTTNNDKFFYLIIIW